MEEKISDKYNQREKDNNIEEEKEIKDNIDKIDNNEKDNINNIDNKNNLNAQIQNNEEKNITKSYSKSFESEKNEKQENDDKENEIIPKKENDNPLEKEENKNNIINNEVIEEKKEQITNDKKKEKIDNEKINIEEIVKDPNKEPELGPIKKSQLNPSITKIKNKSIEQTIKTLLNMEDNSKDVYNKNNFINKLKDLKREIYKNKEKNDYIKRKNIFEFTFKNIEGNNRYKNEINNNKEIQDFNFNLDEAKNMNENEFKELKNKYFKSNDIILSLKHDNNYNFRNNIFEKEKPIISSYSQSIRNNYNNKYYFINNNKPIIFDKNKQKKGNNYKNKEFIRLLNSNDNFDIIWKKNKRPNNLEKNIIDKNKYNILYNSMKANSYKKYYNYKSNLNTFNSTNCKNSKKLQNLINDVFYEIKSKNSKSLKKYEFKSRLSNIKQKIKYSHTYNKYNKIGKNKSIYIKYIYRPNKSNKLNYDDLLNLCSKENLKKYSKNCKNA